MNLLTNPERYTGYGGAGGGTSANIWLMIYKENCFPGNLIFYVITYSIICECSH